MLYEETKCKATILDRMKWNSKPPFSPKYHLPLIVLSIHVFWQQRGQLGFPGCSWGECEIACSKSASCELCIGISRTPSNSVAGMAGDKGDSTLVWVWQPFIDSIPPFWVNSNYLFRYDLKGNDICLYATNIIEVPPYVINYSSLTWDARRRKTDPPTIRLTTAIKASVF